MPQARDDIRQVVFQVSVNPRVNWTLGSRTVEVGPVSDLTGLLRQTQADPDILVFAQWCAPTVAHAHLRDAVEAAKRFYRPSSEGGRTQADAAAFYLSFGKYWRALNVRPHSSLIYREILSFFLGQPHDANLDGDSTNERQFDPSAGFAGEWRVEVAAAAIAQRTGRDVSWVWANWGYSASPSGQAPVSVYRGMSQADGAPNLVVFGNSGRGHEMWAGGQIPNSPDVHRYWLTSEGLVLSGDAPLGGDVRALGPVSWSENANFGRKNVRAVLAPQAYMDLLCAPITGLRPDASLDARTLFKRRASDMPESAEALRASVAQYDATNEPLIRTANAWLEGGTEHVPFRSPSWLPGDVSFVEWLWRVGELEVIRRIRHDVMTHNSQLARELGLPAPSLSTFAEDELIKASQASLAQSEGLRSVLAAVATASFGTASALVAAPPAAAAFVVAGAVAGVASMLVKAFHAQPSSLVNVLGQRLPASLAFRIVDDAGRGGMEAIMSGVSGGTPDDYMTPIGWESGSSSVTLPAGTRVTLSDGSQGRVGVDGRTVYSDDGSYRWIPTGVDTYERLPVYLVRANLPPGVQNVVVFVNGLAMAPAGTRLDGGPYVFTATYLGVPFFSERVDLSGPDPNAFSVTVPSPSLDAATAWSRPWVYAAGAMLATGVLVWYLLQRRAGRPVYDPALPPGAPALPRPSRGLPGRAERPQRVLTGTVRGR